MNEMTTRLSDLPYCSFAIHPSDFILHPFKMVEAPRIELGSKRKRRKTLHA